MEWSELPAWDQCKEPVNGEALIFEREYHLDNLEGSPRQVKYGRECRHKILVQILPKIMELIAPIPPDHQKAALAALDEMRHESSAYVWINLFKSNRNHVNHLLQTGERLSDEARRISEHEAKAAVDSVKRKERDELAMVRRKQCYAARRWEKETGISKLNIGTKAQLTFGSKCRYLLFTDGHLDFDPADHKDNLSAPFWIGKYMKHSKELKTDAMKLEFGR